MHLFFGWKKVPGQGFSLQIDADVGSLRTGGLIWVLKPPGLRRDDAGLTQNLS